MKKRKQPNQSFSSMVNQQVLSNLKPYIDANVDVKMAQVERRLSGQVISTLQSTFARVLVLEELIMEQNPNITKDLLSERVADKIDSLIGFKPIETSEAGCRLRVTIESKYNSEPNFGSPSKTMIDNLGSGNSLTKEIEDRLIGLKKGEHIITDIPAEGDQEGGQLKITVDRASKGEESESSVQE